MKRAVWLLMILGMVAVCLSCCTGGEDLSEEEVQGNEPESVLTVALPQELRSLDSSVSSDPRTANTILPMIFDAPVYYNYDGTFSPGLFVSWEAGPDDMQWKVLLRQGVTFHNGEAFDARSVLTTFRYLQEEQVPSFTACFENLEKIEEVNKYTLVFHFSSPVRSLPQLLQHVYMVAPEAYEKQGREAYFSHPEGCGPFRFLQWESGSDLILTRFDHWWGRDSGESNVNTLVFRAVPDDALRIAQLLSGEVDLVREITAEQRMILEQNEAIAVCAQSSEAVCWSGFSCKDGKIFHDRNTRMAVWYAVNRRLICDSVLAGGEEWMWPVTEKVVGYDQQAARSVTGYDPYLAHVYLSRSGYDGTPVKIIVEEETVPQAKETAQCFAAMLEAVGFSVDLEIMDRERWQEAWDNEKYDMFISGMTFSENIIPWQYQRMLAGMGLSVPEQHASKEIRAVYKRCLEDMAPFCTWFRMENRAAYRDGISGFTVNPDQTIQLFRVTKREE